MKHLLYRDFNGDVEMRRQGPDLLGIKHYGPECALCDKWWCIACGWSYEPWLTDDCPERVRVWERAKRAAAGLDPIALNHDAPTIQGVP